MYCVVAYDIRSNRRRRKVLAALKNYGFPVQLSVVECELDAPQIEQMQDELRRLIHPRIDRVRIYLLCESCFFRAESLGQKEPRTYGAPPGGGAGWTCTGPKRPSRTKRGEKPPERSHRE